MPKQSTSGKKILTEDNKMDLQPSYNLFKKNTKTLERLMQSANAIENPVVKKALGDYIQLKDEHIQLQIDFDKLQKPIDKQAFTAMRARFISAGQKIQAIQKDIEHLQKLTTQTTNTQSRFNEPLNSLLQTLQKINSEQLEELIAQQDKDAIAIKKGIADLIDFLNKDNNSLNKSQAQKLATALDQKFKISMLERINLNFNSANSTPLADLANNLFRPVELQIHDWEEAKISAFGKTLNATLEEFNTKTSSLVEEISTIKTNATALLAKKDLEERKTRLDAQAEKLTSQLDLLSARTLYTTQKLIKTITLQQEKIRAFQNQYSNADAGAGAMDGAEKAFTAVEDVITDAQTQLTKAKEEYNAKILLKQQLDSQASVLLTDLANLSIATPHHSQNQALAFQEHKGYVEAFKRESSTALLTPDAYNKFAATLSATVEKFSEISTAITAAKERIALATDKIKNMQQKLNIFIESAKNDMIFLTRDTIIPDQTTQKLDQHLQSTTGDHSTALHATVEEYEKYKTQKMTDIKTELDKLFQVAKIAKHTQLNTSAENLESKIAEFTKYTAQSPFLQTENIDIDIIKKQISTYREFAATLKTDTQTDTQRLTLEDYRKQTAAIFAVEKQDAYQQNMKNLSAFLKSAKAEAQEKFITNSFVTLQTASDLIKSQPQQPQFETISQQITALTAQLEQIQSSTTTDVTEIKTIHEDINNLLKDAILQTDPILKAINNMQVYCYNEQVREPPISAQDKEILTSFIDCFSTAKNKYIASISDLALNNNTSFNTAYKTEREKITTLFTNKVTALQSLASPSLWQRIKLFFNQAFGKHKDGAEQYKTQFFDKQPKELQKNMKRTLEDLSDNSHEPPSKRPKI